jgi:hypothetical protein
MVSPGIGPGDFLRTDADPFFGNGPCLALNRNNFKPIVLQNFSQETGFMGQPTTMGDAEPFITAFAGELNQFFNTGQLGPPAIRPDFVALKFLYRCQPRKIFYRWLIILRQRFPVHLRH